jgi:DNA-binding GntR family transcriptional regulator
MVDEHGKLIVALRNREAEAGGTILSQHISLSIEDARAVLNEVLGSRYGHANGASAA